MLPGVFLFLLLSGCSNALYPMSTGYHAPGDPLAVGGARQTYLVWSNHVGAGHYLTSAFLESGHIVVERSRVEELFREQRFRLIHSSERETDLLHVGRMAGATQVVFVDVQPDLRWVSTVERLSVSLRSIDVESGTVRWAGTATLETSFPHVLGAPEQFALSLSSLAMRRATCATERGWRWVDPSSNMPEGGCVDRAER